jgi:CCR4-NOT transcription complex subunit 6
LQQRGHSNSSAALSIVDPKSDKENSPSPAANRIASGRSFLSHRKADSANAVADPKMRTLRSATTQAFKANGTSEKTEQEESGWSTLDMGGMQLKNLSPSLFTYTFLTALYIPHNQLTALPPGLCHLTSLIRLDASSNKLTAVPTELGTLISLRELFLFDNQIVTLPPELGTLHMLEVLGIDGNPLQEQLRILAEKEGTAGLVSFLRDSCPVPMPPPEREWLPIEADDEVPSSENDPDAKYQDGFSVLCYNILCEKYATTAMYGYTPSWALSWEYRKELILQEVMGYNADILCLQVGFSKHISAVRLMLRLSGPQEVDVEQYEEYFQHNLSQQDYEGVYWPKTRARTMSDEEKRHVDGCAIFYKATTCVER